MSRLMTAKQAAHFLNFSLDRVYKLVRFKEIPFIRIGRQVRFNEVELTRWLATLAVAPAPPPPPTPPKPEPPTPPSKRGLLCPPPLRPGYEPIRPVPTNL